MLETEEQEVELGGLCLVVRWEGEEYRQMHRVDTRTDHIKTQQGVENWNVSKGD